ncbi:TetR/AcrR family transcriptional regulator C-terminal domain-containing protein [Paractinoplanes durhamensis]|uniref:Tetracycline repressor TetR C-terminal domain-containing protein n=1 Tax=Paractinoplanes durhamensis TaxID=113563 RepID=A0ABQ3Z3M0_9ACTN|nr:TetR/AcrR family transcriptional regulator C-terminal domain-containing protein [Actinoplanes durhamensis]GIE04430.1 hypothetical protein Adu01nite_57800 [Actinoplanes durhamensis]
MTATSGEAHVMAILLGDPARAFGDYEELLTRFVRPERFPALAAAVADGGFGPDPADDSFEQGLAVVLDGLELSMNR